MNFIKDPATQFIVNITISFLGIITAAIVSIIIYRRQKGRKELTYEVISQDATNGVILKIINSGNQFIKADDYDRNKPIIFEFSNVAQVQNVEVTENTKPDYIRDLAILTHQDNKVLLEPLLLNCKDSIEFKVRLNPPGSLTNIYARIAGVPDIQKKKVGYKWGYLLLTIFTILLGIISIFSAIATIFQNINVATLSNYIVILIIVALLSLIIGLLSVRFNGGKNKSNK